MPIITRDQLHAAMSSSSPVLVIDALPASYYAQQHLPGAVNLIAEDVEHEAARLLPADKAALIVTYCANGACPNSAHVAAKLAALGYTNVHKYSAGIQDWVEAGLPTESSAVEARR